jgi:hypothetical protein
MSWWWSWLLTAVGVTGLWFAGRKNKVGWGIGIAAQVLWFTYAVVTAQWGFIVSCVAYGWVYCRNFLAWHRESRSHERYPCCNVIVGNRHFAGCGGDSDE